MLDFTPVREKTMTLAQLVAELGPDDLRRLTNDMVDRMLALIAECEDADVTFEPADPGANDPVAATGEEVAMPWTLGHVIVHTTASAEEAASIAAEMARGVPFHGRSRSEVPWQSVTTIAQCRHRLEESRRIRLASIDMWPDQPNYELRYEPWPGAEPVNCVGRFVNGLRHDIDHVGQIADVAQQARAARA
jgi:hypothetical protein